MRTCTFFGHRDAPKEIEMKLRETVIDLIEHEGVRRFFVGNHGKYDYMVKCQLEKLKAIYPIEYAIVLAYFPVKKDGLDENSTAHTLLPSGIELVPPKFAIHYRNRWMIEQSDYVITYVNSTIGGAAHFKEVAEKKKKIVINISV